MRLRRFCCVGTEDECHAMLGAPLCLKGGVLFSDVQASCQGFGLESTGRLLRKRLPHPKSLRCLIEEEWIAELHPALRPQLLDSANALYRTCGGLVMVPTHVSEMCHAIEKRRSGQVQFFLGYEKSRVAGRRTCKASPALGVLVVHYAITSDGGGFAGQSAD